MLRLSGGRRLQSPPGSTARPTPARVREAVMNIVGTDLPGARWLDLCCGSGVMGCEALQRGARQVIAVDRDRQMVATARSNLTLVAAAQSPPALAVVVQQEVLGWLRQGASAAAAALGPQAAGWDGAFELIYADPPYAAGLYGELAAAVAAGGWLQPQGRLLLECGSGNIPSLGAGWELLKERRYGGSTVLVLQLAQP